MPVYLGNNSVQEYNTFQEFYVGSRFEISKGSIIQI